MSGRGRKATDGSERLLALWEREEDAGDPVGCVATTFTFDAPFFEQHCLGSFVGMDTDPEEDGVAYFIEREERLSQVAAIVLVDAAHASEKRSLRWHQVPVRVPGGGVQHAKVSLLAWERRIRLIVSTANLTEPGYRKNFESAAVFDFGPESMTPRSLLRDAVSFIRGLASLQARGETAPGQGPGGALEKLLQRVLDLAAAWPDKNWPRGGTRASLVTFLPASGGPAILQQVSATWGQPGPSEVRVLSPFFDVGDGARRAVDELVGIMGTQGERSVVFVAPGRRLPDDRIEICLPVQYEKPWGARRAHLFEIVPEVDEITNEHRPLHAKRLSFFRGDREAHLIGSSNFTCRGLGLAGGASNVEANILYVVAPDDRAFTRACVASLPASEDIEDDDDVHFLAGLEQGTPEATSFDLLPAAFGAALFDPAPDVPALRLDIDRSFERPFVVEHEDEQVLTRPQWLEGGQPMPCTVPWTKRRPPSALRVKWIDDDANAREALWIVNVTDTAHLPPPEELKQLPLELLLEVLTSALPMHEVVRRALREAAARSAQAPVTNPHALVDTRGFLLRRVRVLSDALEGLRTRLERPVHNQDALRWRLLGPIGPVALASRLAEQEGEGAAFMVAEVALAVQRANWDAARAALGPERVQAEVRAVLERLAGMAKELPAPSNLRAHVDATLGRILA